MAAKSKSNKIELSRIYDAPVKAVWDAWTDPAQAAHWWGPRGFTITTHSKDLRSGGTWKYTMHGPDGVNYPNITLYHEVVPQSRLIYDHGATESTPPLFRVTVAFAETKGKTKMDMSMAFATPEVAESMGEFIKKANGYSTWDRLAEYLEARSSGKEKFFINRTFDASIETMYEVWTNPKHIAKWLAPTGMNMGFIRADIKPGGSSFYFMDNGAGMKMFGRAHYLEMTKPTQLKYTQEFCTEDEKISRHPMAPVWPETMLTVVTFTAESPTRTRVTIQWEPHGNFTPAEAEFFAKARSGMHQGWTGSFDKLEGYFGQLSVKAD